MYKSLSPFGWSWIDEVRWKDETDEMAIHGQLLQVSVTSQSTINKLNLTTLPTASHPFEG